MCNNVAPMRVPFFEIDTTKGPCELKIFYDINIFIAHE